MYSATDAAPPTAARSSVFQMPRMTFGNCASCVKFCSVSTSARFTPSPQVETNERSTSASTGMITVTTSQVAISATAGQRQGPMLSRRV